MDQPKANGNYSTSLREEEWEIVKAILGGPPKLGRPPRFERRAVLDAIFYMVRTGGAWRLLPHDLPPWRIVYYYYARWRQEGLCKSSMTPCATRPGRRAEKKSPNGCDLG